MNRRQLLKYATALGYLPAAVLAAADPAVLATLRERLVEAPVQTGDFEQRRTLRGFRNPLVSRGSFVVARGRGVAWITREPFASSMVLTATSLKTGTAGAVSRTAKADALLGIANTMLFALLTGDTALLQPYFDLEGRLTAQGGWTLDLNPRDSGLARWLATAQVQGDSAVQHVSWRETSGDTGSIVFSRTRTAAALTADEARYFDH